MNLFGNARLCKFAKIHCKNPKMPRRRIRSILIKVIVKVQLNAKNGNLNVTFWYLWSRNQLNTITLWLGSYHLSKIILPLSHKVLLDINKYMQSHQKICLISEIIKMANTVNHKALAIAATALVMVVLVSVSEAAPFFTDNTPSVNLPTIELPTIELPTIELPEFR